MACKTVKEYLSQRGITFEEKNVADDPDALKEMVEKAAGAMATPTVIVGDQVIIGYHPQKLDEALKA